jgi:hypothetical protein
MTQPDLALSSAHDLQLTGNDLTLTSGLQATEQAVRQRLGLWQGNWFLDTSAGVPYLQQVFVKGTTLGAIRAILLAEVAGTVGIETIDSFTVEPLANRGLDVTFTATTGAVDDILVISTTVGA